MNFLALSATQTLLLAGLTAAAVVFLFFLKLRRRRIVIGSSLLWSRVLEAQDARSLAEKLRRLMSLLLALAIALLIALAIGRPWVEALGRPRPILVVLDTSPSMGTRNATGTTRWSRAIEEARRILSAGPPASPYMVADTSGHVHTPLTGERNAAIQALEQMRPFPGEQRFPSLPTGEADVFFITDGIVPFEIPDGATEVSVFEPGDNVAVTAFQIRVDPTSSSGYRAFLEIVNYSPEIEDVGVLLDGAGDQREAWRLELAPDEEWQADLDLAGFRGGGLRVRIEAEGDGLELDDVAYAYLPPLGSIRVALVTDEDAGYLETLLRLSPRVDLRVVRPSAFDEEPVRDAYIFEGYVPPVPPPGPAVFFGTADVDWLPASGGVAARQVITSWEPGHPVMRNVPVYDMGIVETAVLEPRGWEVVAASDQTPLILVSEEPSRSVLVGFRLEDSDLAFHLGFPIFIENVLGWFSGEGLAEPSGLGHVTIPAEAGTVTTLDGTSVPSSRQFGQTVVEAPEPELFTAALAGRRVRVAANLADRSVSAVNRTRLPAGYESGFSPAPGRNELWFYMLLGACLLVAVEWWTYHRRITV